MLSKAVIAFVPFLYSLTFALPSKGKCIDWVPCPVNSTNDLTCATLDVPLDYEDSTSNRSLPLQLNRVAAPKQPKKGSILINPGGPGESGLDILAGKQAQGLLIATGGVYDIIGFNPRGVGETIPFSCYKNATERAAGLSTSPVFLNASDTAIGARWASAKTIANNCYHNAKDIGSLVGTGYVARDMMQIVDALQEDGQLHYWGFSYGTALGETVAAMFPDRMGRVVLDGVLTPRNYYAGLDYEEVTDSDISFDGFFKGCIANPTVCALAQDGATAQILKDKFYDLLYSIKYQPLVLESIIVDYQAVKLPITTALYNPSVWPVLASGLHGLMTGNLTAFLVASASIQTPSPIFPNYGTEANYGVRAGDNHLRTDNLSNVLPIIEKSFAMSRIFGDWLTGNTLLYAQWPFHAKGGYTGDWDNIKTKNPILFIGSDVDPLTPLVSAINASTSFPGSVVLQHGGYGHTSLGQASLCTAKVVRSYFVNGTFPAPNTKCEPSFPLFANKTTPEALAPIVDFSKRAMEEDDDAILLAAIGQLSKMITPRRF